MTRYLIARLAQAVVVVFGVVVMTFVIARLIPGDPAVAYAGPKASASELAQVRRQFGLDLPWWRQFIDYVGGLFRGDLGVSLHTKQTVMGDLGRVIPASLVLVSIAMLVAAVVGIGMGVISARSQGRVADLLTKVIAILIVSMPVFWLAILLQVTFFSAAGVVPSRWKLRRGP